MLTSYSKVTTLSVSQLRLMILLPFINQLIYSLMTLPQYAYLKAVLLQNFVNEFGDDILTLFNPSAVLQFAQVLGKVNREKISIISYNCQILMGRIVAFVLVLSVICLSSCQFVCPDKKYYSVQANACIDCFYACAQCTGPDYTDCTSCTANRGVNGSTLPINGICECFGQMDEDLTGNCIPGTTSSAYNMAILILFIINCLLVAFTTATKGMRFFIYRMIDDFQEVSLIVFINLQFPQQMQTFLQKLYWFNFTSIAKIFESMGSGTLFIFSESQVLLSKYQTLSDKFRLMMKTSNFLSNSFNIFLLFIGIALLMYIIKVVRNCWAGDETSTKYKIINRIYNMSFYGMAIFTFYFSIVEINVNTAIQIMNMNITTAFSVVGLIFCGLMVAFEIVVIAYFLKEYKQETLLKLKYRNPQISTFWYLINDQKFVARYYWFWCVAKKIVLVFIYVCLAKYPHQVITGVAVLQCVWLVITVYAEPYERMYLRLETYVGQTLKMLIYVALTNFSEKYVEYLPLVPITNLIYLLIALMFANYTVFILCHILIEHQIYWRALKKKLGCEVEPMRVGGYVAGKLRMYQEEI